MKYKIIFTDLGTQTTEFQDFNSAMRLLDGIDSSIACELICTGHSPITIPEAQFYAESAKEEFEILDEIGNGKDPEECLKERNLLPLF